MHELQVSSFLDTVSGCVTQQHSRAKRATPGSSLDRVLTVTMGSYIMHPATVCHNKSIACMGLRIWQALFQLPMLWSLRG